MLLEYYERLRIHVIERKRSLLVVKTVIAETKATQRLMKTVYSSIPSSIARNPSQASVGAPSISSSN